MQDNFTPLLPTHDWNDEWKRLQRTRPSGASAEYWSGRAKTYDSKAARNPYAERFLELAGVQPGETVLDMGCGTGALSVPLATTGNKVVAADFSDGMLEVLTENLAAAAEQSTEDTVIVQNVRTLHMSWDDDWATHGIGENSVDVAFASRSIATADLRDSLARLTSVARRRVCITVPTSTSPRADARILAAIDFKGRTGHDYLYTFNVLVQMGILPEVSYIDSMRDDTFDTAEEAFESLSHMVTDPGCLISDAERDAALVRLREWLDADLQENPDAGTPDSKGLPQKALKLQHPRHITWAFLAWNK